METREAMFLSINGRVVEFTKPEPINDHPIMIYDGERDMITVQQKFLQDTLESAQ